MQMGIIGVVVLHLVRDLEEEVGQLRLGLVGEVEGDAMPGSGSKGYQDAARESSARARSAWTMGVEREALPTIRRMRREGATLRAIADALGAGHCPRPQRSAARWNPMAVPRIARRHGL